MKASKCLKVLQLSHIKRWFAHFTFLRQVSQSTCVRWGKMILAWLDQIPTKCVHDIVLIAHKFLQDSQLIYAEDAEDARYQS